MAYLTQRKFSFSSSNLPPDTFGVVRFRGSEGLSRCYAFEVTLVSDDAEVDLKNVIRHPATLAFHRQDGEDVRYQGILLGFEQLHAFGGATFYRAHLVPRLHWLSLTRHNQVFLSKTAPEFITECLHDGGLSGLDFEFRLLRQYEPLEYVCQYGESHLNFVTRWLEREGMYYYFEQTDSGEKAVFTDSKVAHTSMPQGKAVRYYPVSGLETLHMQEIVSSFTCRYSLTPAEVLVKDYNYLKPSLEVTGTAKVDEEGRGLFYSYGDHIGSPEEGHRVAKVYAESVLCRREVFHGEGSVPYVSPGFVFQLEDHYRKGFNQGYLTLDVDHEGCQTGYLLAGLTPAEETAELYYRNSFTAIPESVQFRPERATPKPRIAGCISARVDAAASGRYAELDEHGRYKVVLPFDTSGRKDGKASAWFRMAQPYAGSDHGMHFPLHKGTEVLLTFIDGDPDRPVIQGAAPNPEMPSQVTAANQTMSKITTAGGNKIHMEDQAGTERILMHVPNQQSFFRMGAVNDPPAGEDEPEAPHWEVPGIREFTKGALVVQAAAKNEVIGGESSDIVLGAKIEVTVGLDLAFEAGGKGTFGPECWNVWLSHERVAAEEARVVGNRLTAAETTITALNTEISAARGVYNSVATRLEAAESRVHAAQQDILAAESNIQTNAQHIATAEQNIGLAQNTIRVHGQNFRAVQTTMESVGTHMKNAALSMRQADTNLANAAVDILGGSLAMRNSGIILDG